MDSVTVLEMIQQGWLTTYPLGVCSVIVVAVMIERLWRYRGVEQQTRNLTREVVEALAQRDVPSARALCQTSKAAIAAIFKDAFAWKDIALEDLERVLATSRQESSTELRRGLWILGTIGSLAPFVGLFGTVVGIMKAFHQISVEGSGGFTVVAAGISEALIATAVGLGVAIVALAFYNYLNVRAGHITNGWARACEKLIQALLYVESSGGTPPPSADTPSEEMGRGDPLPA